MILVRVNDPVGGVKYEALFARQSAKLVKSATAVVNLRDRSTPDSDDAAIQRAAELEAGVGLNFYPFGLDIGGITIVGVFADTAPEVGEVVSCAALAALNANTAAGGKEARPAV